MSPKFLLSQLTPSKFLVTSLNLFKIYEKKPKVMVAILKSLLSEEILENANFKEILMFHKVNFDAVLLPCLFPCSKNAETILEALADTNLKKDSIVLQVATSKFSSGQDLQQVQKESMTKLAEKLNPSKLTDLLASMKVASNFSVAGAAMCCHIMTEKVNKKSAIKDVVDASIDLVMLIQDCLSTPQELEDEFSSMSLIERAKVVKMVPFKLVEHLIKSLAKLKQSELESSETRILKAACDLKKSSPAIAEEMFELYYLALGTGEARDVKLIDICANEDLDMPMRVHCMKKLVAITESKDSDTTSRLVKIKSDLLPSLLPLILCDHRKLSKQTMKLLENLSELPAKGTSFSLLVNHLVQDKEEILADPRNVKETMSNFFDEYKSKAETLVRALLKSALGSPGQLARLIPFLEHLDDVSDLNIIATHGSAMLEDWKPALEKDLEALISYFITKLVASIKSDDKCKTFFEDVLKTDLEIRFGNIPKSVAGAALEHIDSDSLQKHDTVLDALFPILVSCSYWNQKSDVLFQVRHLTQKLPITTSMYANAMEECLETEGNAKTKTKARKSRRSTIQDDTTLTGPKTEESWTKIVFLLELLSGEVSTRIQTNHLFKHYFALLKSLCDMTEEKNAYAIDLVLSCIHQAITDAPDKELERLQDVVNPELLVHCIKNCVNPATKSTALLVLARVSTVINAEYVMQNALPIFTFMGEHFVKVDIKQSFDTALQVSEDHV